MAETFDPKSDAHYPKMVRIQIVKGTRPARADDAIPLESLLGTLYVSQEQFANAVWVDPDATIKIDPTPLA